MSRLSKSGYIGIWWKSSNTIRRQHPSRHNMYAPDDRSASRRLKAKLTGCVHKEEPDFQRGPHLPTPSDGSLMFSYKTIERNTQKSRWSSVFAWVKTFTCLPRVAMETSFWDPVKKSRRDVRLWLEHSNYDVSETSLMLLTAYRFNSVSSAKLM